MSTACKESRTANLLGAFALAGAEHVRGATEQATGRSTADTAALVALTTWLGGASQEQVGHVVGLTQTGSVRLVDRLVRDGLAERRPGADGRTNAIVVSAAGAAAGRQALGQRQDVLETALAELDADEITQLDGLLSKLLGSFVGGRADARHVCRLCDYEACEPGCPVTVAADAAEARRG